MKRLIASLTLVAALAAAPAASSAPRGEGAQNIVATAAAAGQFKTLLALATKAGLAGTLRDGGPYTVFAPTDAAFKKVPKATLAKLQKNPALLKQVLLYHVVSGEVPATTVVTLRSAKTLQGQSVRIKVAGRNVFLNGSTKVIRTDVTASNGVIHVINKVLLPRM